jgi:hypothetical protein
MKLIRLWLICFGLLTWAAVHAQIVVTNRSGQTETNSLGKDQSKKLIRRLTLNMSEERAKTFLQKNGLGFSFSFGDSFGWVDCFPLTNDWTLVLRIEPKKFRPDGAWKDGLLKAVSIRSNDTVTLSRTLTNAP